MTKGNKNHTQLAIAEGPETTDTRTLHRRLTDAAAAYPTRPAVVSLHQPSNLLPVVNQSYGPAQPKLVWSFQQLNEGSDLLASCLYNRGISRGRVVALLLYNCAEWALIFWACAKLGATFVPLDPRSISRKQEITHYLRVTRPAALVVGDESMINLLEQSHEDELQRIELKLVAQSVNQWGRASSGPWLTLIDILADPVDQSASLSEIWEKQKEFNTATDIAQMIFTSGTSTLPKACPHTSGNLWAAWLAGKSARLIEFAHALVQHLPVSHIFAIGDIHAFWYAGASVIFPAPSFSPATTLDAIDREQVTHMSAVPSLLMALIGHPSFEKAKMRSLQLIGMGGTVISPEIVTMAEEKFGVKVSIGFGMSEGMPTLIYSPNDSISYQHGYASVGRVAAGVRIKICDTETRKVLSKNVVGELHVCGGMMIKEYLYGDNEVFYQDEEGKRWMMTGDQAKMDDSGAVYILGRYKDVIIRAGENLSPALIEASLNKVQGVTAQVVGVPDEMAGELPVAVVQIHQKAAILPMEAMQDIVIQDLGQIHAPALYLKIQYLGLETFPMTTSGKVRKSDLKKHVAEYLQDERQRDNQSHRIEEDALARIFASILGQSPKSLLWDKPFEEQADSINLLRFVAHVKRDLSKEITLQDVLGTKTLQDLAKRLESLGMVSKAGKTPLERARGGPPTMRDMVHTHGDESRAYKTQEVTAKVLQPMGMSWEQDVEDVFPISGIASKHLANTRAYASTVRITFVTRTADVAKLDWAIKTSLTQWALFRSISVWFDQSVCLYVVLRIRSKWSELALINYPDVDCPQDLCSISLPLKEVSVRAPGPLMRIIIARVRSTGTAGAVVIANHAVLDAVSMGAWVEDLHQLLSGKETQVQARTPYKMFADCYYSHRSSLEGQMAVTFHVQRLQGINSIKDSLWPPQRCPGWFIGDDSEWQPLTLENGFGSNERKQLDDGGWRVGYDGIMLHTQLLHLGNLWSAHGISVPVLFKSACALLNSHITGKSDVLFSNTQAGRQWPFLQESMARCLPNPVTIAGLTYTRVVNRISVDAEESVGDLLACIEDEQRSLTLYAHAPIPDVLDQLSKPDGEIFMETGRQAFNWRPDWRGEAARLASAELKLLREEGHSDCGVIWHCGMLDSETARLKVQWDGAQVTKGDMQCWAQAFVKVLDWLQMPDSWDRRIDDFCW